MNRRSKSLYVLGLILVLLGVAIVFPFSGGAQAPDPQTRPAAKVRELPDFDAFGASTQRTNTPGQTDLQGNPQSEAGHLVQVEPRLGVPSFLWASDRGQALSVSAAAEETGLRGGGAEAIARDHLSRYASRYQIGRAS